MNNDGEYFKLCKAIYTNCMECSNNDDNESVVFPENITNEFGIQIRIINLERMMRFFFDEPYVNMNTRSYVDNKILTRIMRFSESEAVRDNPFIIAYIVIKLNYILIINYDIKGITVGDLSDLDIEKEIKSKCTLDDTLESSLAVENINYDNGLTQDDYEAIELSLDIYFDGLNSNSNDNQLTPIKNEIIPNYFARDLTTPKNAHSNPICNDNSDREINITREDVKVSIYVIQDVKVIFFCYLIYLSKLISDINYIMAY